MTERRYGRLAVTIGSEMSDAGLSPFARLVYQSLECQQKMSACGMIELQERRWMRDTGLTAGQLDDALVELDAAGWALVDHDTFEVLATRHVRDDIQVSNPKTVAGVWNAVDRIESPRLRQAAVDHLPDHFPPRSGNRSSDPLPDGPDDASPGDRPVPCSLSPVTSSSSRHDATPLPVDKPDDDDPTSNPDDPTERAQLACQLIGNHDCDTAIAAGQAPRNPTAYRAACQRQAHTTWAAAAGEVATNEPDWTPADIAQHLTALNLPTPAPPATARAPDIDLRTIPTHTNDRGAPVVDLETARRQAT